ncbi:hypothetical protein DL98DRAFT_519392 [Cadophora sp. DSE1049]|nr:hypothetical protein DL98DRAFT_519392 [Cadophora sp. DSE1049]
MRFSTTLLALLPLVGFIAALGENRLFCRSEVPTRVAALQLFARYNSYKTYQGLGQKINRSEAQIRSSEVCKG